MMGTRHETGPTRGLVAALGLMLCAVMLLATACGGNDEADRASNSAATSDGKTEKITIAQAVDSLAFLPVYVALSEGYWKDQGLDVELKFVKGGPVATSALVAKQVDVASNSSDTALLASKAGADVEIVANLLDKGLSDIVVRKSVLERNGISEVEWKSMSYTDRSKVFKGTRWAIIGPGGLTDLSVRSVITAAGFDPEKDTKIIPIGDGAQILAALRAGRVDAIAFEPPFSREAINRGFGVLVGGLYEASPLFKELSFQSFTVRKDFAASHKDAMRKLGAGIAKACDFSRNSTAAEVAKSLHTAGYFKEMAPELLEASVSAVQPTVAPGCRVTQTSIDKMVDFYVMAGEIKKADAPPTDQGEMWTNEYLPGG